MGFTNENESQHYTTAMRNTRRQVILIVIDTKNELCITVLSR
jgi:hypothetical protein